MTDIPKNTSGKKLGLVIDLDICVGCHACAVNCKEWNTSGHSAPLPDNDPFGANVDGVWFNRVHTFECGEGTDSRTVHFPRSCLHCEQPACVEVCPTGASYKRAEDGIVRDPEAWDCEHLINFVTGAVWFVGCALELGDELYPVEMGIKVFRGQKMPAQFMVVGEEITVQCRDGLAVLKLVPPVDRA